MLAVVDALGLSGAGAGFGHSLGGAALLGAEQRRPGTFRQLWCFEPIVFPTELSATAGAPSDGTDSPMAARGGASARDVRLVRGGDRQLLLEAAAERVDPDALRAYVDHGFAPQPDGTVRIKCAGRTEATIYRMAAP